MSIHHDLPPVNTLRLDDLFDADKRTSDRAARLAMTAADMIRSAENRYRVEYMLDLVHQGGYGRVEVVVPVDDPASAPWVHLLPVGWQQTLDKRARALNRLAVSRFAIAWSQEIRMYALATLLGR